MTVAITQYPTYPIPGRPVRLTFTVTDGEYVRVYITDAPKASKYWAELDKPGASQLLLYSGDDRKPWTFTPDVAGKYALDIQDITKGAATYGGGYSGSADGYQTETINDTSSVTIVAGSKLEMPIGWGEDTATLRLYVWDDTIRATNTAAHGEATPGVFDPSSERADNAAQAGTVEGYLAALEDVLTTDALNPTIESVLNDLILKFAGSDAVNDDHLDENAAAIHAVDDTHNNILTEYQRADNPARVVECVVELHKRLDQHMRNDQGGDTPTTTGTGSAAYHAIGGEGRADYENATVTGPPSNMAEAVNVLADCWRAYAAHRVDTTYHTAADTYNAALALSPLLLVFYGFFVELSKTIPAAHATDNDGAKHLAAAAGMTET